MNIGMSMEMSINFGIHNCSDGGYIYNPFRAV